MNDLDQERPALDRKGWPSVGIVLLNWNGYDDTSNCLSSLKELTYPNLEVVVVDNGSSDGSGHRLKEEFPNTHFVFNEENKGFAGGMNEGIREALKDGVEYIWLLNNDIVIPEPNILQNLVMILTEEEDIGICSPKVNYLSNRDRAWFERGEINRVTYSTVHSSVNGNHSTVTNDYVPFCSSLISKEVFEEVGALPEQYFLYYEDAHFCKEVRECGYEIITLLNEYVLHRRQDTNASKTTLYYTTRNRILFADQFKNGLNLFFVLSYFYWVIHRLSGRVLAMERERFMAILRGVIDGMKKCKGRGAYP